jgi:class 3 adenylate cyclase/tetratricopeptide (TPR) repeat protein
MLPNSSHVDPFVSDLLRQSVWRRGDRFDGPFEERVPAALFFGDLSGFTEVAERLASDRSRGAEETQRILNEHFRRVLEVIDRWGGTLLKFAGDATIAIWPATEWDVARATSLATRCALDLQARIEEAQRSDRSVVPHRVVVGSGTLWLAHVGGFDDKWEFIVAGEPWTQIRAADKFAEPGRVVVSREAWSQIAHLAQGECVADGCYCVTACASESPSDPIERRMTTGVAPDTCTRYLARPLVAHLVDGQREWLAEYRWVTVLFLAIDRFNHDEPDALHQLHAASCSVQRTISMYDGHILQFIVDDKGLVALAAWGISLASHEDDAERAIRAACNLRELTRLGLAPRIGIKSGRVFAGLLGHDHHLEYAIIGDPVNAASRISRMSTDDILCDRATRDAAQQRFDLELVGAAQVKGKSEPIEVFRVVCERPRRELERPRGPHVRTAVDRDAERALLSRALDAVCAGTGTLLHVVGEPGIGKSNFVEIVTAQAKSRGLTCAVGAGDSLRRTEAYFAWTAILPILLDAGELIPAERALHALATLGLRSDLAPLLNPLLPEPIPETSFTRGLDSVGRAELTRELLADIVLAADQRSRLLIVLDDAHWFDSATWSLLVTLRRRIPNLALVLLSRPLQPSNLSLDARRILDSADCQVIEFGPLSYVDSRALIASRLAVGSISDELAQKIFERAEGNPLFTEELLLSLEQQDVIRRVDLNASIARDSRHTPRIELPDGIDGIVASRIASLDPVQQLTIKVASVLGRSFRLSAVAALHPIGLSEVELADQLDSMCESRLLEHLSEGEADSYRFHHSIIQNVVHDLLVSDQQRQLHRAAAELLERDGWSQQARASAILAHHWGLAQEDRKAIDYLELAAEQARQAHAMLEVSGFLREAFQRAERCPDALPLERRARWEQLLGEAEMELGLPSQAEQHLRSAVAYLDRPQPGSSLELAAALARECAEHVGVRTGVVRNVARVRARALSAARAYSSLAMIYYNNHELGRMLHATLAGANLAMRVNEDSAILARMLASLSVVAALVPGVDPDYYAHAALEVAERVGDPVALQEVLMVIANYEMGAARFADALAHCQRAVALYSVTGEPRLHEMSLGTLSNVFRLSGDFGRADEIDRQVLKSGLDRGVAQTQVWGFFGRACALTHLNRIDELRVLLRDFELLLRNPEVVREVSASNVVAFQLTGALLHLHDGRTEDARRALATSVRLLSSLDHVQVYMTCTLSYLDAALMGCWRRTPRDRELQRWAEQADRFTERCARQFPCAVSQALLSRGNRALRQEQPRRAARAYRRALDAAIRTANLFDQAYAHFSLSRCTAVADAERAVHTAECDRCLRLLGIARPFGWSA